MEIDVEGVKFILNRIKMLKERGPNWFPTHRNIWQGSYDVWFNEQDQIDAVEIPKARMKEAEEGGYIKSEIVRGKYDMIVYSVTELGEKLLEENNEKGT